MTNATEPTASPEPLSEAYHKARRNLALFSGILIAWEYVGFSIGNGTGGVTAKGPADLALTLQHPEVIPVVVLVLILYFAIRLGIEWKQCDETRRRQVASHWDIGLTYFFAGTALFIFAVQQMTSFQLAAVFTPITSTAPAVALAFIYFMYGYTGAVTHLLKTEMPVPIVIVTAHIVPLVMVVGMALVARHWLDLSSWEPRQRADFIELTSDTSLGVHAFTILAHFLWSVTYWKFYYRPKVGDLWEFTRAASGGLYPWAPRLKRKARQRRVGESSADASHSRER